MPPPPPIPTSSRPGPDLLPTTEHPPRLVLYAQTHHSPTGAPYSLLPLLERHTGVTHVIVAAFHLNARPGHITLNDDPPDHPKFAVLWEEVRRLRAAGVTVMGMLGGAAKGTYERLSGGEEQFESYYQPLLATLRSLPLTGLDLDIEEPTPLTAVSRLLRRLRADMGPSFTLSLAPVATALIPDPNPAVNPGLLARATPFPAPDPAWRSLPHLSGFDHAALARHPDHAAAWAAVAFLNVQFYNGWGGLAPDGRFVDAVLAAGWDPAMINVGVLSSPRNGRGYVAPDRLRSVLAGLRRRHRRFGGVMAWEYFNAGLEGGGHAWEGADTCEPWRWVRAVAEVVRVPESAFGWDREEDAVDEGKVEILLGLGIPRDRAVGALRAADGNVEVAASLLFQE